MLDLLPIALAIVLMQITPGPNMLAVSAVALGTGRRAGLATAGGVATGVLIWAVLFAFGMGAFLDAFPQTITLMKLLGGSYLVYLGLRSLIGSFRTASAGARQRGIQLGLRDAFVRGFLVVLSNPKAALMWVAISILLAAATPSASHFLLVGVGASLSAMTIYGAYALLFSTGIVVRAYGRLFKLIDAGFGILFGALGGRLLLDGLKEARS
ncbi:MAG: LysE family translocator [Geminicoccaceae bacterium]